MEAFEKCKLGDILSVITDYHANGSYEKLKEKVSLLDVPNHAIMIRTTNFEQNNFSDFKYINEEAYSFLSKSKVFEGDILMNKIANAGSVYFMPKLNRPVSLAMNLFLIRISKELANAKYVYLYLKLNEGYIKTFAAGSVTKTITKAAVRNLDIYLPSLPIQNKVVEIISSIDDKIELNLQMNQTLEQIAKTLFKKYFVDDVDHEKLPNGWILGSFSEIIEFFNGYAFSSKQLIAEETEECYHVFKMGHIKKGGGLNSNATKSFFEKNKAKDLEKYVLKKGDLLMCMTDMKDSMSLLGHTALMNEDEKYIVNQRVGLIRSNNYLSVGYPYLYLLTNSKPFIEDLRNRANSGVQVNLSTSEIKNSKIIIPSESINKEFDALVLPLYEKMFSIIRENTSLEQLRNALLPKLMSGELDVTNLNQKETFHEALLS